MYASIILPTYCECGNIAHLITAIEANLAPLGQAIEILVVDDASPDGTAAEVQALIPLPGFTIRCLVRQNERGLATAIRHGILNASGDQIIVIEAKSRRDAVAEFNFIYGEHTPVDMIVENDLPK